MSMLRDEMKKNKNKKDCKHEQNSNNSNNKKKGNNKKTRTNGEADEKQTIKNVKRCLVAWPGYFLMDFSLNTSNPKTPMTMTPQTGSRSPSLLRNAGGRLKIILSRT